MSLSAQRKTEAAPAPVRGLDTRAVLAVVLLLSACASPQARPAPAPVQTEAACLARGGTWTHHEDRIWGSFWLCEKDGEPY